MENHTVQVITSAVAPIVMVSAAGLLSTGVQAKNLHLGLYTVDLEIGGAVRRQ